MELRGNSVVVTVLNRTLEGPAPATAPRQSPRQGVALQEEGREWLAPGEDPMRHRGGAGGDEGEDSCYLTPWTAPARWRPFWKSGKVSV